jgi:hypothetical protein
VYSEYSTGQAGYLRGAAEDADEAALDAAVSAAAAWCAEKSRDGVEGVRVVVQVMSVAMETERGLGEEKGRPPPCCQAPRR